MKLWITIYRIRFRATILFGRKRKNYMFKWRFYYGCRNMQESVWWLESTKTIHPWWLCLLQRRKRLLLSKWLQWSWGINDMQEMMFRNYGFSMGIEFQFIINMSIIISIVRSRINIDLTWNIVFNLQVQFVFTNSIFTLTR